MPHLQGGKFAGSHTTVTDAAVSVAKAAAKLDCVTKITFGVIQQVKSPAVVKRLKTAEVQAGLRVTVRGSKTVQELYVYTSDRVRTVEAIQEAL